METAFYLVLKGVKKLFEVEYLGNLMERDYAKLGLKCGLECHQQLDTKKLFCRCPSVLRDDAPDSKVRRYIRAVASELGEYDRAALEAMQKELSYIYEAYNDTTCLIEMDEEPPKPVDSDALKTTLEVALMSGSKIMDELFVMRKAVADGSNTTGFQKTMLVAIGGEIPLEKKDLGILTIALEEDAARPMERKENEVVYRLDRLGIPLIELATEPGISTPAEAKEAALAIGQLFRRTGMAKRGLGTIRQDVNISIAQGARVEIKGVQELDLIDVYVEREIERQEKLLEIKREILGRGIRENNIDGKVVDLTDLFKATACKFIANCLNGCKVMGVRLRGFDGLIGKEIQPDRRFGTELASYVKSRAGIKGLLHSDELPAHGVSEGEVVKVREKLGCEEGDGFAFVCAPEEKAVKAIEVILERCREALTGVPEETRNALDGGNTEYSRPLPGAARMYPETDLESVKVDKKLLAELKKDLPLEIGERRQLYREKFDLSKNLIDGMVLNNHARFFEKLVGKGFDATKTAVLLLEGLTQLKRDGIKIENISEEMVEAALGALKKGQITQDILLKVMSEWSENPVSGIDGIIAGMKIEKIGDAEVIGIVRKVISDNGAMVKENGMRSLGALMGDVMKEARGKADGGTVSRILKEELKKVVG